MHKFNKYLYILIFSMISVLVFLIDYMPFDTRFLTGDNAVINFFMEINHSIKNFDIVYVALWVFILYFYNSVYLDGKGYDNKCKICTFFSVVFSIITVISKNYFMANNLNAVYSSYAQIFKTIIFILGYYLIYYAIIKKIFNIKWDIKAKKKLKF